MGLGLAWLAGLGAGLAGEVSRTPSPQTGTTTPAASVPSSPGDVRPLLIGSRVPDVTFTSPTGEPLPLRKLVEARPAVLIFYRGGW